MFKPAPIRIKFGRALHVEGVKSEEIIRQVQTAISGLIADLRAMKQQQEENA